MSSIVLFFLLYIYKIVTCQLNTVFILPKMEICIFMSFCRENDRFVYCIFI